MATCGTRCGDGSLLEVLRLTLPGKAKGTAHRASAPAGDLRSKLQPGQGGAVEQSVGDLRSRLGDGPSEPRKRGEGGAAAARSSKVTVMPRPGGGDLRARLKRQRQA